MAQFGLSLSESFTEWERFPRPRQRSPWQLTRAIPALDDYWFWFYQLPYYVPMIALLFTRSRRTDIALFTVMIGVQLFSDFDLGASSRWGREVGISLIEQSSTSAATAPK